MKSFLFIATVFFCTTVFSQHKHKQYQKQEKISNDLYFNQISDSIYMLTHYFPRWGGNSMFILLPNHKGVLIDTPYELTGTQSLLTWISEKFGELELIAIVTGYHQDNLGGNALLLSKGINVYGANLTKKLVKKEGDTFMEFILKMEEKNKNKRYYESYSGLTLTPPNKTFPIKKGLKLKIENEVFEVYFPGETHTIDNTVVYLHHNRILFGGCMFKGTMYNSPGLTDFANMDEWPRAVDRVVARFGDCQTVIPGHGDYGGPELLSHMQKVLKNWHENHADK
ncbi:hypothetical protein OAO55_01060 [Bacteroidales bacterium]|nr:hypothetical protein [Bacteroidales bacterium]